MKFAIAAAALSLLPLVARAQDAAQPAAPTPTITTQSTLVLVPAIVHDKTGQVVFNLKASDFALTDNGEPQKLRLEQDSCSQPLALVVDVEGGGAAADRMDRLGPLIAMLDSLVGGVPHRIAVVGFDSAPALVTDFTSNNDAAAQAIKDLIADGNGDDGAGILDSLAFSLDLLRKQPPEYRRVILLVSETHDNASHIGLNDAMRSLSDSNTAIYSIAFSSSLEQTKHQMAKLSQPDTPGPAGGCFARDAQSTQSRAGQYYDCVAELAPPLALAKAAFIAMRGSLEKNIPETAARLTGGEYFTLGKQKQFERDLLTISNHLPNRYILSFQPQPPSPGYHTLKLTAPNYEHLEISGRTGYWAEPASTPAASQH